MSWASTVATGITSSALTIAVISLLKAVIPTATSRNTTREIANKFVEGLLVEARLEREELRATIRELEQAHQANRQRIDHLERMIAHKELIINTLERQRKHVAAKLRLGVVITREDVFGATIIE